MEVGNLLKEARLAKGYTLEEVEEATKIRSKYLEALENEKFDILPGKVYVIAFLRNYCKFLGISDEELVQEYRNIKNNDVLEEEAPLSTIVNKEEKNKKIKKVSYMPYVMAVVVLVFIFAISNFVKNSSFTFDNKEQPQIGENTNKEVVPPKTDTISSGDNSKNNATTEGVNMVLEVSDENCWMEVNVDGKNVFSGIANPGEKKEFAGNKKIDLKLGNAGAVDVKINGNDLGNLAPKGQVITRRFTPEQG